MVFTRVERRQALDEVVRNHNLILDRAVGLVLQR